MSMLDAILAGIRTILADGSAMPSRSTINFTGDGVTVEDDAANERTNVTITSGGGGGGHVIRYSGEDLPARATLEFAGAVSVADNEEDGRTVATFPQPPGPSDPTAVSLIVDFSLETSTPGSWMVAALYSGQDIPPDSSCAMRVTTFARESTGDRLTRVVDVDFRTREDGSFVYGSEVPVLEVDTFGVAPVIDVSDGAELTWNVTHDASYGTVHWYIRVDVSGTTYTIPDGGGGG